MTAFLQTTSLRWRWCSTVRIACEADKNYIMTFSTLINFSSVRLPLWSLILSSIYFHPSLTDVCTSTLFILILFRYIFWVDYFIQVRHLSVTILCKFHAYQQTTAGCHMIAFAFAVRTFCYYSLVPCNFPPTHPFTDTKPGRLPLSPSMLDITYQLLELL